LGQWVDVHINIDGIGDRATRIYRQLRAAVLDGRLRPGDRLPPTRELAARLGVARNTVAVAYERLTAEGFLTARVGAGTYVGAAPVASAVRRPVPGVRPQPIWDALRREEKPVRRPYGFPVGTPDSTLFPLATWRRLVSAELRSATLGRDAYADAAGEPGLRAAIARYVGVSRSVRAAADDVVVTQGAQQALDLIGRVLVAPGDTVAVEEPGYPPARDLFRALGARVVGVPVDGEGLVVDRLPSAARLVYVTPSHQFPLGTPMSLARRAALLDWVASRDAAVIEDDYDSEFRFSDRPLDPLQSLDRSGRVIYVGTFSKTLLPVLRLGYAVAPPSLLPALRTARRLTDWHGDVVAQAALARFIDSGELSRHVRRASRVYAERHRLLTAALAGDLSRWLTPVPSAAGLHVCALSTVPLHDVVDRAAAAGVAVERLAAYRSAPGGGPAADGRAASDGRDPAGADPAGPAADGPTVDGLVLGYGATPTDQIEPGLRVLAGCFAAATEIPHRTVPRSPA
jgi:GntR family transcriptional regulator/MocR family aminotransferase